MVTLTRENVRLISYLYFVITDGIRGQGCRRIVNKMYADLFRLHGRRGIGHMSTCLVNRCPRCDCPLYVLQYAYQYWDRLCISTRGLRVLLKIHEVVLVMHTKSILICLTMDERLFSFVIICTPWLLQMRPVPKLICRFLYKSNFKKPVCL